LPGPEAIPGAVETALSGLQVRERLTATGLLAEEGRLKRALKNWLELDSARQGFEVDSLEEAYALALGRALLKVRVDHIDRLSDGRLFLIDYKSGKGGNSRALKWLKPRMQEPQLPLYAALLEAGKQGVCGGLTLAAVKPGECGFDGISDDPGSKAKGIRVVGQDAGAVRSLDWPNLQAHWRSQAAMLCEEILAGRADNHVYDADLMRYCDVALILRHEQAVELSAGEATRVEANDGS
jgi:hypothetical protein